MKQPNLLEVFLFDESGKCVGLNKGISPDVRAAWDKLLGESANRAEAEYQDRVEAARTKMGTLGVMGDWALCLAEMCREGVVTQEQFDAWRIATTVGVTPVLSADIADELYDRVAKRLAPRTMLPDGMTDLEHALSLVDAERATEESASEGVKATAQRAKRIELLHAKARPAKKVRQEKLDQDVLDAALAILHGVRGTIGWADLAFKVGEWLTAPPRDWFDGDEARKPWDRGTSKSSICERLDRVKSQIPSGKIGPWKKVSED